MTLSCNYNLAHTVAVEMEGWENPACLGPREAKENTSSPIGTVCSLKYIRMLPRFFRIYKWLKIMGFSANIILQDGFMLAAVLIPVFFHS